MTALSEPEVIEIAGAGSAGLAAAITLARAGCPVIVHEAQSEVGHRFKRDLQGVENWSSHQDSLEALRSLGMPTDFDWLPCHQGTAFDAWGQDYSIHSEEPLFYPVERGPGPGTLDSALLRQAQAEGATIRFDSRIQHIQSPGILATGPKAADAIAVGFHFDTPMPDGFWVICDDDIAPRGYAYLLIMQGKGTVKSCMFSGFKQEALYVQRTLSAFKRLVGLEMTNVLPHGGAGNFRIPRTGRSGIHLMVGEQAGFQDTLWGFGMRLAITSGVLAARSLIDGQDYDNSWNREIEDMMAMSVLNRAFYGMLGNRGYRWALRRLEKPASDARDVLHRYYRPSVFKRLLMPLGCWKFRSQRRDESCNHINCDCVWCRHGRQKQH
jgi:flavin-dependent dehydrogenase